MTIQSALNVVQNWSMIENGSRETAGLTWRMGETIIAGKIGGVMGKWMLLRKQIGNRENWSFPQKNDNYLPSILREQRGNQLLTIFKPLSYHSMGGSSTTLREKHVVIVGGGYAGITLANQLKGKCQMTLIDPKECFHHCVGGLRAAVEEGKSPV